MPKKVRKTKAKREEEDDEDDDDEDEDGDTETEDDSDDDEDEDDDSDDDDDDDEGEDESDSEDDDGDDDDEDSDDDSEDEDDSDDDDDDEESSSDDGEELSWDTDDAEGGGLPEGRCVLLNPRTRLGDVSNYPDDDPEGVPLLSIDCVPVVKGGKLSTEIEPFEIHLTNGKRENVLPNKKGTGFIPNPDAKRQARGMARNSNTFYFTKSLEEAGFPKKKLKAKGIVAIHGTEVEITRVAQPKRTNRNAAADDPDAKMGGDTMPSVTTIYSLPWESKGKKARAAAEAALSKRKKKGKGKKSSSSKSSKKKGAKRPKGDEDKRKPAAKSSKKSSGKPEKLIALIAEKAINKVLKSEKYARKGIAADDAYTAIFPAVKENAQRKAIMKLVQSAEWMQGDDRPWLYDDKTERYTAVG